MMSIWSKLLSLSGSGDVRTPVEAVPCPQCTGEIRYYRYSGMGGVAPHFYCDSCSNFYFSGRHHDLLYTRGPSPELLAEIVATLPNCPCGGQFVAGANPKCPHCDLELKHRSDPVERLTDPYAIQLENARFISGK